MQVALRLRRPLRGGALGRRGAAVRVMATGSRIFPPVFERRWMSRSGRRRRNHCSTLTVEEWGSDMCGFDS